MFTYQIRPRILILDSDLAPTWPADAVIEIHFAPKQPFGTSRSGGRTAVRDQPASVLLNNNSGQTEVESESGLEPLEIIIEWPDRKCELMGHTFRTRLRVESLEHLEDELQSAYFALPSLLNTAFADPPFVTHVGGSLNGKNFRWELARFRTRIQITDQDHQETSAATSILRLELLAKEGRRRLLGSLHYFHIACRLSRASATVGEFMAETLLNLSKTLEVLFPGDRDSVRSELLNLGYTPAEIEARFMPAMLLRSKVDSAHVLLSLFNLGQLKTLHAYTLNAEDTFRELLVRVFEKIEDGTFEPKSYAPTAVDAELAALVERIRATLPADS